MNDRYGRFMKKINFVGIGAPKSATTWLASCLAEHPEIYLPSKKEISYFSSLKWYLKQDSIKEYHSFFSSCKSNHISGEISVSYLGSSDISAERIYNYNKNIKLVCVLREPLSRSYAHFKWLKQLGNLTDTSDLRAAIDKHPRIITDSFYGLNLANYLNYFAPESIFVADYSYVVSNPSLLLEKLFRFLGVEPDFKPPLLYKVIGKTIDVRFKFLEKARILAYNGIKNSALSGILMASKKLGLSSLYRTLNSKGCAENSITQEQRKILSECLLEDRLLFSGLDLNKFSGIKDGLPIVWGSDSNR